MARDSEKDARPSKKQKVGPVDTGGSKKTRTTGSRQLKVQKKRLLRRISSGRSVPSSGEGERRNAPTFYQPSQSPRRDSQLARHRSGRSTCQAPRDSDDEEEDEEEEECDSDDEGGEKAALERLRKLPESERYKVIGKVFALKIWPWPSSDWWIGGEEVTEAPRNTAKDPNSAKEKLLAAKKKLPVTKKREFAAFLVMDMDISSDIWMTKVFRSQVHNHSSPRFTTDSNNCSIVSAWGTVTPI